MNCERLYRKIILLDSENYRDIPSGLYGYMITEDGTLVFNEMPEKPGRAGVFTRVENLPDRVRISQDFLGAYGLYLYENDGYFALSNSFFALAEKLKGRLTLNKDYINALLYTVYAPVVYEDSPANEIRHLTAEAYVEIQKNDGTLTVKYHDMVYAKRWAGDEAGLAVLDRWYRRWVRVLRTAAEQGLPIVLDLSGGFDTRIILSMAINAGLDLNTVQINSHVKVNISKDADDYPIACSIAKDLGFTLNRSTLRAKPDGSLTASRGYEVIRYSSLGDSILNKYPMAVFDSPALVVKGIGSNIKAIWATPPEKKIVEYCTAGVKPVFARMVCRKGKKERLRKKALDQVIRYTRRQWELIPKDESLTTIQQTALFRRKVLERMDLRKCVNYIEQNLLVISPYIDPDIYGFDYVVCGGDTNSLALLILARYGGRLLDYPIQGREKREESLRFIRELNARYPVTLDHYEPLRCNDERVGGSSIPREEFGAWLKELTDSRDFQRRVCRHVRREVVETVLASTPFEDVISHPEKINALLAVYEMDKLIRPRGIIRGKTE